MNFIQQFKEAKIKSAFSLQNNLLCKRFIFKYNYAKTTPRKPVTEKALNHFDTFNEPVYKNAWPTLRVGLLSQPKYCALINNFSDVKKTVNSLWLNGAVDIIDSAKSFKSEMLQSFGSQPSICTKKELNKTSTVNYNYNHVNELSRFSEGNDQINLQQFMSTTRVPSAREELDIQEECLNTTYESISHQELIIDDGNITPNLSLFAFEVGNPKLFLPPIKSKNGRLGYCIIDGASLLPVLALDVQPNDLVADLCCGTGCKTMILLQTLLPSNIICIDRSYENLNKIKNSFSYFLSNYFEKIQLNHIDIFKYYEATKTSSKFDKIILDVPCNSDRHSVMEFNKNMFIGVKQAERLELVEIQCNMLYVSLQMLKVGGSLIYTTTTLSQIQNDGVIEKTLNRLNDIDKKYVIHDLSNLVGRFQKTFKFSNASKYGQLVLPYPSANFGPVYFCKLTRIL